MKFLILFSFFTALTSPAQGAEPMSKGDFAMVNRASALDQRIERAKKWRELVSTPAPPARDEYAAAYWMSLEDNKPLAVFVGQPSRPIAGFRCVSVETHPYAAGPCVVIGVPDGAGKMSRNDLPGSPTDDVIRACLTPVPPNPPTWSSPSPQQRFFFLPAGCLTGG